MWQAHGTTFLTTIPMSEAMLLEMFAASFMEIKLLEFIIYYVFYFFIVSIFPQTI